MNPTTDQQPSDDRQRRVRRGAGLLAGGAVLATCAIALPALATTEDQPPAAADRPGTTVQAVSPATALATTTTTTAPPAPSPDEVFASQWESWSEQERLNFRLWVGSPEERAAIIRWISPPPAPKPAPKPAPARAAQAPSAAGHEGPDGYLACVRQRESGGRYSINTGNGYYGAYQFLPSTWNSTAQRAGRDDLVGVLPSNASPADQDAMAQHLYSTNGRQPWRGNGC